MKQNLEPKQWREGINPFKLPLKTVKIKEILGYPHAANQIFYLKGVVDGEEDFYY